MALPQDRPVRAGSELNGFPDWAWIALTVAAAGLQALRTAAQKWLSGRMTTDAATYVRSLFAWPVAVAYAAILALGFGIPLPWPTPTACFYAVIAATSQIAATRFLLMALESRNFAVGVAYSKTDVVQAAIYEALVLGASITLGGVAGVLTATAGVMVISLKASAGRLGPMLVEGLRERAALFGLASGASFAIAGVSVRALDLSLDSKSLAGSAIVALLMVLTLQVIAMGGYIGATQPQSFHAIGRALKASIFAGVAGGLASTCWFLALGLQKVAYVRTLGLVEIMATMALSRFLFRETARANETLGIGLLLLGIALVLNSA